MSTRKRPSLRGRGAEIFLTDDTERTTGDHQRGDLREEEAHLPANQHNQTPGSPSNGETAFGYSGRKEKATFYLPEEVVAALEETWRDLRVMTHAKVKKSEIVRAALERTTEEFRRHGTASRLLEDLGFPPWSAPR
ncbi:MAG TPA: hypothetical protein ENI60_03310 [Candidatus Fraserbacteria bacterium]|nr:hypothetical protein [Candidatus Fraserbacteria bacterium]